MKVLLFDAEADGFIEDVTKVHCIVAKDMLSGITYRAFPDFYGIERKQHDLLLTDVGDLFGDSTTLIGHNIIGYDLDLLYMFFGLDLTKKQLLDTMVWSQTLNPDRQLPPGCPTSYKNPLTGKLDKITPHSVAAWGYRVSKEKPKHFDWLNFSPEMLLRCEADVQIQELIFFELLKEAGLTAEEVYK